MKLQQSEQQLWLQGVYIYEALIKVAPILHAFAKNGTKPEPYSDKPYGMFKKPDPKEKEMEKELEIKKAQIFFQNWASANKNIK